MGNIDEETKKTTVFHQKTLKWKLGNEKNITLPKEAAGNRGTHRMGSRKWAWLFPAQSSDVSPERGSENPRGRSLGHQDHTHPQGPLPWVAAIQGSLLTTAVPQHPDSRRMRCGEVTGNHKPRVRPNDKKLHPGVKVAIAEPRGLVCGLWF